MIRLTVITVTWNAEKTLERTLKSVREQSYPFIEHVVVDGNSGDRTVSLIKKYENEHMVWISQPDQGLYDAMNKGMELSSGDYYCFLNAGDTFFSSDTVMKMMQSLNTDTNRPDIIYGETAIVDSNGVFLHMRRLKAPEILTWKCFKLGMMVCHQAFIVKRELAEPYSLSYRYSSDFDWCIRMMIKATHIHNTKLTLINYLNEGMTTSNRKASLKERYNIMAKHYGPISTFLYHIWFVFRAILKPA